MGLWSGQQGDTSELIESGFPGNPENEIENTSPDLDGLQVWVSSLGTNLFELDDLAETSRLPISKLTGRSITRPPSFHFVSCHKILTYNNRRC
jgi:hypothetical protein